MKILVPLNQREYLKQYAEAGADEFYFGFYDEQWMRAFGENSDINRMSSFHKRANAFSLSEALAVIREVRALGKSVFLTFNANLYTEAQMRFIDAYFELLKDNGADGVIISNPRLIGLANKWELIPVASTMCGIYNEDIVHFYHKQGLRRMIFPRELSLDEIDELSKLFPDVCFEVFFMRNGCIYSDSNCLCQHIRKKGGICAELRTSDVTLEAKELSKEEQELFFKTKVVFDNGLMKPNACAQCALYRFLHMNVSSLKIVGRADPADAIVEDIRLTKNNLEIAKKCSSHEEYLEKMIRAQSVSGKICNNGLNCYYPEARYGKGE